MGKSFHISCLRSLNIRMPIPSVHIVDDGDIVNDRGVADIVYIIVADIDAGDMLPGTKIPISRRWTIGAIGDADVYAGTDGRPTIIAAVFAPGDPGRSPFITRGPHPSIRVVIEPIAVVEGSPAPAIIGYPGPAILRIDPVTAGAIGTKTGA